jgi:WD40 repeat protein
MLAPLKVTDRQKDITLLSRADPQQTNRLKGHTGYIWCVAFTPDGRKLLSGSGGHWNGKWKPSDDNTIRIWDTETMQELGQLRGHSEAVIRLRITPDGTRVISSSRDNTVRVWDLSTAECLAVYESATGSAIACTPNGRYAVAVMANGDIQVLGLPKAPGK